MQQVKTDVALPKEGETPPAAVSKPPAKPVHVDFSKKEPVKKDNSSPFHKPMDLFKRFKAFLWGEFGSGKTTLALQFWRPVLIDMEGGADHYAGKFDFEVLRATTFDEAVQAVDWLLTHEHDYRTLIIDPITVLWDALQKKWSDIFLRRNKGAKGYKYEFYELGPREWASIKSEFKDFVRKLVSLDMNVIVTARQKTNYKEGSFMLAAGETFDAEKSLPYMFDTIVRLYVDERGQHMGVCLKDRSGRLPTAPFEIKFELFESLIGKETLTRKSKPVVRATEEQKAKIAALLPGTGMSDDQITERLAAYGAETLDDLTRENADLIIQKIEAALESMKRNEGGN